MHYHLEYITVRHPDRQILVSDLVCELTGPVDDRSN
jgi:hypothetical protein